MEDGAVPPGRNLPRLRSQRARDLNPVYRKARVDLLHPRAAPGSQVTAKHGMSRFWWTTLLAQTKGWGLSSEARTGVTNLARQSRRNPLDCPSLRIVRIRLISVVQP